MLATFRAARGAAVIVSTCLAAGSCWAAAEEPEAAPVAAPAQPAAAGVVGRQKPFELSAAFFRQLAYDKDAPKWFVLDAFDGRQLLLELSMLEDINVVGDFALLFTIEGVPHGYGVIAVSGESVSGSVHAGPFGEFRIRRDFATQTILIEEYNQAAERGCGTGPDKSVIEPMAEPAFYEPGTHPAERGGGGERGFNDPSTDVLIVYTASARTWAGGGTGDILSLIDVGVVQTNVSYNNSNIGMNCRPVRAEFISYTESTSASTNLSRLRGTSDGFMDGVHATRNTWSADQVCLITDNTLNACGIAYCMATPGAGFEDDAFSVVAVDCLAGYTFAHELGHNHGCAHDRDNVDCNGSYSYSFGYRFFASGTQYRTVMAYAPGTRIANFSNPNVNYLGVPTGDCCGSDSANNALTINNNVTYIVNWRVGGLGFPDSNDQCSGAITLGNGVAVNGSTTDALNSPPQATCGLAMASRDEWYRYVAPYTGVCTVSACGSSYDTVLAVWSSCSGTQIACNDDSCGLQSQLNFNMVGGTTYYIQVAGYFGAAGDYTLVATGQGTCTFDTTGTARVISSLPYSDTGNTAGCVNNYDEVCPFTGSTSPDLVYRYEPVYDQEIDISLCGSAYDTKLYVYRTSTSTLVACADDTCPGSPPDSYRSQLSNVSLLGGSTYYIVVDGYAGQSGIYDISVNVSTSCGNDTIGTAQAISLPFSVTASTVGCVNNYDEVCPFTGSASRDRVYRYTPAASHAIDISLCGSLYDTKLYVYRGSTANLVACADDTCPGSPPASYRSEILGLDLIGGQNYYIVVDGYAGQNGVYDMVVRHAAPSNDTCPDNIVITSLPYNVTMDNTGATADGPPGTCNSGSATTMQNSMWFVWRAQSNCMATLTVNPTTYDGIGQVYTGNCAGLTPIAGGCGDEPEPYTITWNAVSGTNYRIQIGDWGVAPGGGPTNISLNCTGSPCPGDYNMDGVRNTADFFEFFGDFFGTPPDADYNMDGATNTADFFEFFSDFFGPPCV